MADAIKESRNSNGITSAVNVRALDAVISGTFLGTWQLKALLNDEWAVVAQGTDAGAVLRDFRFSEPRQIRFDVTGITMGTINFNLAGRAFAEPR